MILRFKNWDKYNKRQKDIKRPFWFAMSNEIFTDAFYVDLSDQERQAFLWLLCEASKQNKYGEFEVSERLFCQITGYKKAILDTTIAKLLKSGRAAGSRQDGGGNTTATEQNITVHNTMYDSGESHREGFNLNLIYQEYPRRRGQANKGKGLEKLKKLIKTEADFELALAAVRGYKVHLISQGKINTEFVKMFSSFWDAQGDWKEWAAARSSESLITDDLIKQAKGEL